MTPLTSSAVTTAATTTAITNTALFVVSLVNERKQMRTTEEEKERFLKVETMKKRNKRTPRHIIRSETVDRRAATQLRQPFNWPLRGGKFMCCTPDVLTVTACIMSLHHCLLYCFIIL